MKLSDLLKDTGIECADDAKSTEITGICYDSRRVERGNLFVCIRGFETDGHSYAQAAADAGAAAVLACSGLSDMDIPVVYASDTRRALSAVSAAFYGHPSKDMRIFGITGTNGKTTISYLIKAVVEASGEECGVLGTIAYSYGDRTVDSVNTTPESSELQRMFFEMKHDFSVNTCAMEVSSHSLALSRTDDIDFDYSIFTNLTPDHMDFHKDFEDYYRAKKKLFEQTKKCSLINIDDEYGKRLYGELVAEGRPAVSCGVSEDDAYYKAVVLDASAAGTDAEIYRAGEPLGTVHINTPGAFSVSNALCAAAAAIEAGVPWQAVRTGIENTRGVPGRFEPVENSRGISVIVDYAHTPDALEKVIKTAREFTGGRVITVFGCGGDRDRTKRPLMGETAGRYSDYCVVTSDNPRTEDPDKIIEDIIPGIEKTGRPYDVEADRRRAIKKAIKEYKPDDTVIIAGKGHETYQITGTVKQYFDDRETAMQIIEQEI